MGRPLQNRLVGLGVIVVGKVVLFSDDIVPLEEFVLCLGAKLVPTFADRGVSRGQRNGSPRPLISAF
jgi:hypothetical protein